MSRRECPECGVSALLTLYGVQRVYQGTPSWSELRDTADRLENNPHADRMCTKCKAIV